MRIIYNLADEITVARFAVRLSGARGGERAARRARPPDAVAHVAAPSPHHYLTITRPPII